MDWNISFMSRWDRYVPNEFVNAFWIAVAFCWKQSTWDRKLDDVDDIADVLLLLSDDDDREDDTLLAIL